MKIETRNRLLEAANNLLQQGSDAVRLEDVARAARVSRQSVYLHFGSRMGLFQALAEYIDANDPAGDGTARIEAAADGLDALDALVELRAEYIPRVHAAVRPVLEARKYDSAAAAAYASRQSMRRREYALVIKRLDADGHLSSEWSVKAAVDVLRVMLSIPTWEQFVIENKWSNKRYEQRMKMVLRSTLVSGV